jgi:hypothetical protein
MSEPPRPQKGGLGRRLEIVSFDFGTTASTATTFSQYGGLIGAMDPGHVQRVRAGLIKLVTADWPVQGARDEFVNDVLGRFPDLADWDTARGIGSAELGFQRLARWLEEEAPDQEAGPALAQDRIETRLLDDVWARLATFITLGELRDWGNEELHGILHESLLDPAFTQNNLTLVTVEGDHDTMVGSVLVVHDGDIASGKLSSVPPLVENGARAFRGLKRRVLDPVPLPPGLRPPPGGPADSDALIGQAYNFLKGRVEEFARVWFGGDHQVTSVVVTYPTTTPPPIRERLRGLVKRTLNANRVLMRFDEGTAALMFVLMRDFGGDDAAGIEVFRARSRGIGPGRWRQNLLVIDIGGGTTDIALTRLELRDLTNAVDKIAQRGQQAGPDGATEEDPRTRGRVYVLRPEVLGSTGHPQYGGDLLTLRVFYWIKAVLADAVREAVTGKQNAAEALESWPQTESGSPVGLAHAVVNYREPGPGPRDVLQYLREVLPTRSPGVAGGAEGQSAQLTPAFHKFWNLAQKAKEQLAGGDPYDIVGMELEELAGAVTGAWKDHVGALTGKLRLSTADFERLATRVLTPAIALAVDLARRRLANEPGELLDGIALTGRAADMPLVRALVLEQLAAKLGDPFGERPAGAAPLAWNPSLVTTEHGHPKQAASVGACWGQAKYENLPRSLAKLAESDQYKAGRDLLVIDVDNLLHNLPCDFGLGTTDRIPVPLLNLGDRLQCADSLGHRFTRTGWKPAQPDIRLLRFLDQEQYRRWGHYNVEDRHFTSRHERMPADLYYQIEIDDELVPTLHFCLGGVPRYVLHGSDFPVPGGMSKSSLDGNICVLRVDESTGDESWQPVIDAMTITSTSFPYEFSPLDSPLQAGPQPVVRGLISRELPAPARVQRGDQELRGYTFAAISPRVMPGPDGRFPDDTKTVGTMTIPAPERADAYGPDAPHWVILTESGRLYLAGPGYPRYQLATDMESLLAMPGSVFSTAMELRHSDLNKLWDPFTGEH